MTESQRLLVATDFSAAAEPALDRAWQIARDCGLALTLMHALELERIEPLAHWMGAGAAGLRERLHEAARAELARLSAGRGSIGGSAPRIEVASGLAGDEIHRIATATDAALLVLGAHGQGFVRRVLMGSTASRTLRKSRHPVLLVKHACEGPYCRVLVALDFAPASIDALRLARRLLPTAHLLLMHVYDIPYAGMLHLAGVDVATVERYRADARATALRRLHEAAADAGLGGQDYSVATAYGDPARRVVEVEHEQACDLVVIGKHGRHPLEELLLGSVATHVLAESRGDVLVVPGSPDAAVR